VSVSTGAGVLYTSAARQQYELQTVQPELDRSRVISRAKAQAFTRLCR
jgi:hypothetical protein